MDGDEIINSQTCQFNLFTKTTHFPKGECGSGKEYD